MIVTINTDASFHPTEKFAAYAFWISCNEGRFTHAGILKEKVKRAEIAEIKCIVNAFYILSKLGFKTITKVIVNTDCLNAIHILKDDKRSIKKYNLGVWRIPLKEKYDEVLSKGFNKKIKIEFRHIKSHQPIDSKREWVNDWCDRAAKIQLRNKINHK